jgi:Helix-turn-helix domain
MDAATRAKGRWHLNRHINWARRLKLSGSRKNVLFVLADHANTQDEAWPKVDTICDESGHCRDTVIAALDELEKLQRIQDTGKRKGKTQSIKVYRLSSAEIPTTKQSEKSEVSGRIFPEKQSEFSGEAVGKDRLVAVGKIGLLHEANKPKNQTPNPQGSHNEPTNRIECANNGLPEHIANILKTPDDRLVFDGSDWLGSLEKALGPREWKQCGGMWRMRARSGVEHAKALRNATEDFFMLTPVERDKIKNRGAWITDRYERGFEKCRATAQARSNTI